MLPPLRFMNWIENMLEFKIIHTKNQNLWGRRATGVILQAIGSLISSLIYSPGSKLGIEITAEV